MQLASSETALLLHLYLELQRCYKHWPILVGASIVALQVDWDQ